MSEIPPPLIPDPPEEPQDNSILYIPFVLADAPRLQLDLLSRHRLLPQAHRDSIKEWLRGYNNRIVQWLHERYGPEAVAAADAISRASAQKMNENRKLAQEQVERDLFSALEKELGYDDE